MSTAYFSIPLNHPKMPKLDPSIAKTLGSEMNP